MLHWYVSFDLGQVRCLDWYCRDITQQHRLTFHQPPIVTALMVWYSLSPYLLPSRPTPLSLTPPNGDSAALIRPVLTPTIPHSSRFETRSTRLMFSLNKYPARPNSVRVVYWRCRSVSIVVGWMFKRRIVEWGWHFGGSECRTVGLSHWPDVLFWPTVAVDTLHWTLPWFNYWVDNIS